MMFSRQPSLPLLVLCVVLVSGLWLAVVESLPTTNTCEVQDKQEGHVSFGYAFYLLLVGGLFSLGGASFNLLCARSAAERRRQLRLRFRYVLLLYTST